ncbi:MAG: DUF924 family protein [Arenimonas sp.]
MTELPAQPSWIEDVLAFWFEELGERQWFAKDPGLDARIRARFGALHAGLLASEAGEVHGLRATQAAILVLDQFSRNLFRGDARAFAGDAIARRLARDLVDAGLDAALPPAQRMFVYLPFEHSEDASDQALSVRLTSAIGNDSWTTYAIAHQRIIERFGRFPHRNAALGRESSAAELALLDEPMGSF